MTKIMKKINFNGNNETEIKEEKQLYAAAYNSKTLKDQEQFNAVVYKNDKKYIIVDCDDEKSLNYVNSLFKNHKLDNNVYYTKSISNIKKINKFKYHFYFNNNLNLQSNKIKINSSNLDILVNSLVFEHYKQYKSIDFDDLPEMSSDIYIELLKYNSSSVEPVLEKN